LENLAMQERYLSEQRDRFTKVMAARATSKDLIDLFDKLAESDKFAIAAKPYCFADLLTKCALRVPSSKLDELLIAIDGVWAGDIIRHTYGDGADPIIAAFVRRALEVVKDDDILERRLNLLYHSGLVRDATHALMLAIAAGLPESAGEHLRDALNRLAARPRTEPVCPF
jgi:hypothetical protein